MKSDTIHFVPQAAEVAELADALRSGRSEITLVRVQIPPSAHKKRHNSYTEFAGLFLNEFAFRAGNPGMISLNAESPESVFCDLNTLMTLHRPA